MQNLRKLMIASSAVAAVLLGGGCGSDPPQISAADAANFSGKNVKPMTEEQKKGMGDTVQNFNKLHPPHGGPGVPPAGMH